MTETAVTAEEVARKLKRKSARALDRRHMWSPAFPQPLSRHPLTWREADVDDWILRRSQEAHAR